jgi:hypothetical protein
MTTETTTRVALRWERQLGDHTHHGRVAQLNNGKWLTVWRDEPAVWRWYAASLANPNGIAAYATYPTWKDAQLAAEEWWHTHGSKTGLRTVRRLYLGHSATFLANTGAEG